LTVSPCNCWNPCPIIHLSAETLDVRDREERYAESIRPSLGKSESQSNSFRSRPVAHIRRFQKKRSPYAADTLTSDRSTLVITSIRADPSKRLAFGVQYSNL